MHCGAKTFQISWFCESNGIWLWLSWYWSYITSLSTLL